MATKKEIRITFRRMWEPWSLKHFKERFPMLLEDYHFVHDNTKPHFVFYSVFGNEPLDPDYAGRIFYTGENQPPNMAEADWAISFRRDIDDPRHMRIPNYALVYNHVGRHISALLTTKKRTKREKFCAFIQRKGVKHRNSFVKDLMRWRKVDCAGPCMNNCRDLMRYSKFKPRIQKLKFLKDYMFCVCFENERGNGYVTEKITDAFMAGCIPIYWGDPKVTEDFNPKSFINANDRTFSDVIGEVKKAWQNGGEEYLKHYPFHKNRLPDYCDDEKILEFFRGIFK